ncbi:hypothetical protein AB9L15_01705 [Lysinibacillus fusiformis]|uniref:hypothetical protein n=1 Tax=Lysinibacillus fusiformis TaxID=28031 RepID=UPI0035C0D89F
MGNSKFYISKNAKDFIDSLKVSLEINDTPTVIKLALAKGLSSLSSPMSIEKVDNSNGQWLVPENIIKDREYLLFKHLIINEYNNLISDHDINKYFAFLIEKGTEELKQLNINKASLEDLRTTIFTS